MKRLLSYIWPITKYIESAENGRVEVTWVNGKKILDTKNANFSYGSAQRILRYGLSRIEVSTTSDVLLLGLGAGSVIHTLRKEYKHTGKITAIELDKVIITIAEEEFDLKSDDSLEIIAADAFVYIKNTKKVHGIIIVDLFIDKYLPEECYSVNFWKTLTPLVEPRGAIVFNVGFNDPKDKKLDKIIDEFKTVFDFSKHENIVGKNTLLIAKKL